MQVAGRVIEGELKERAQAREDYRQAIEAGRRAAIAKEERGGTFSLRVGNIPAKEEVAVELTLVGPVPVTAGEATFRFPLVVAPRYVPGMPLDGPPVGLGWGPDTDQVPDGSRVTPPVLLPGFPNPVRLALEVALEPAGLGAAAADWSRLIRCSLHAVITDDGPPWTVRLQPGERLDRDFILRFPIATEAVESTLLCSPATPDKPGVFALTLVPPAIAADSRPAPRDVVIVLDRSGSMAGWKMVAARRAVGRMVDTLLEQDRFTILALNNTTDYPDHAKDKLVEATDRNRWQALEWLAKIEARGGTEMGPALQRATELVAAANPPRRPILVLITDGQVAGEDVILRQLQATAGVNPPCIHAIGIDRAVNAGFLQRLADLAGGTCDLVESEDRLDVALDHAPPSAGYARPDRPAAGGVGLRLGARELDAAGESRATIGSHACATRSSARADPAAQSVCRSAGDSFRPLHRRGHRSPLADQRSGWAGSAMAAGGGGRRRAGGRPRQPLGPGASPRPRRSLCGGQRRSRRAGKADRRGLAGQPRALAVHGLRGGRSLGSGKSRRRAAADCPAGGIAVRLGPRAGCGPRGANAR